MEALREGSPLRILAVATYYRPYLSGLTVYLQRLAETLALWGHQVTVLTAHWPVEAPREEFCRGVKVVRAPVWFRAFKGVVAPGLPRQLWQLGEQAEVVWLVLPQAESALLAWLAKRRLKKPLLVSYLCDVTLGRKPWLWCVQKALEASHRRAMGWADAVVALSHEYAATSPLLRQLATVTVIPPPVPTLTPDPARVTALQERLQLPPGTPVVGWVGRVSREKGLDVLARAMPLVWAARPEVRVVCVGPREEVAGERGYLRQVEALVRDFGSRWRFVGTLAEEELAAFYGCCAVLAFPSVNRTEAFGMVQLEAMGAGTPVVASDLPGVREPVQRTGMGLLVPPQDPQALATALLRVLAERPAFSSLPVARLQAYAPAAVTQHLLCLFVRLSRRAPSTSTAGALE
ncbi:MAG: glycosyltransferase family 4 protein [Thermoanaerobaculum sp.]|nr:glycosyltransferase family 4 protein [Thermoanaerobaculum sp.]